MSASAARPGGQGELVGGRGHLELGAELLGEGAGRRGGGRRRRARGLGRDHWVFGALRGAPAGSRAGWGAGMAAVVEEVCGVGEVTGNLHHTRGGREDAPRSCRMGQGLRRAALCGDFLGTVLHPDGPGSPGRCGGGWGRWGPQVLGAGAQGCATRPGLRG